MMGPTEVSIIKGKDDCFVCVRRWFSALQKNEVGPCVDKWLQLETVIPNDLRQSQKGGCCVCSLICVS